MRHYGTEITSSLVNIFQFQISWIFASPFLAYFLVLDGTIFIGKINLDKYKPAA